MACVSKSKQLTLANTLLVHGLLVRVAASQPVVDGSGAVTGLAFYKLQQELATVSAQKEEDRLKAARTTDKLVETKSMLGKER